MGWMGREGGRVKVRGPGRERGWGDEIVAKESQLAYTHSLSGTERRREEIEKSSSSPKNDPHFPPLLPLPLRLPLCPLDLPSWDQGRQYDAQSTVENSRGCFVEDGAELA